MSKGMDITVLTAVLVLSVLGCREGKKEPTDANETAGAQIKQKADEALQAATDYMAQQKDKLVQAAQGQLDALETRFQGWLDEAGIEDEQAKEKLSELGAKFERALSEARGALAKAKEVGADAWEEAKPGLDTAVKAAQQAYDEFVSYIRSRATQQEETPAGQMDEAIEE